MEIGDKTYDMNQLREKMPKYDMFLKEKVVSRSHEEKLDNDPIATTNPNLHMRFDESAQLSHGEGELFDRRYKFLGLIGTKIYSFVEKFMHDEEDTEFSEIP